MKIESPSILDLFCCQGGAGMGYWQAGFKTVVGVDHIQQNKYPFDFVLADAMDYLEKNGNLFDFIHASPPCQRYSVETPMHCRDNHPDLIGPVRSLLRKIGKAYIIENVPGAKNELENPIMLCGSSFGLKIFRHRYFEIWPKQLDHPPACKHNFVPVLITGTTGHHGDLNRKEYTAQQCREASGLHWMTRGGMDQAIPPAYTKWIGEYLLTGKRPEFPPRQGLFF